MLDVVLYGVSLIIRNEMLVQIYRLREKKVFEI
jgi:hypothetical protein